WLSPTITAMMGASLALALAFVWHAGRAEEPFLPLSLIGGRVVPYAILAGSCALGAMVGLTVHLPLYYEVVYHLSASEAGLALIPLAAISTAGAAIAGRTMAHAKHYKRVAIVGDACAALAGMALGADISLGGEHRGPVNSIASADMIAAFSYVFGAAAVLLACATLCMILMEEKPLAGPATQAEMAEEGRALPRDAADYALTVC